METVIDLELRFENVTGRVAQRKRLGQVEMP